MRFTLLLLITIFLTGCSSDYKIQELESEKISLQETIDSLRYQIAELTKHPADIITDIKNTISEGELEQAKLSLLAITSHRFTMRQTNEINKLLAVVNNKLEQKDYQNLSESDPSLYSAFIKNYPKSKYSLQVKKKIKKLRQVNEFSTSDNPGYTKSYRAIRKVTKSYGTTRVGAMCCDGTRSYATGRGACSHHGGVCQWLYR